MTLFKFQSHFETKILNNIIYTHNNILINIILYSLCFSVLIETPTSHFLSNNWLNYDEPF